MSTHASVHFLLFTLNVAYDALLCTLPLSPVSVRSHTAGYRGLPMPLHSTASLRHGLFTQSRIEEHLDWALTLLSPYSFLETFFCSELQYIPLSWLSCCFPDYSIICSLPSAHTLNLTVPMPCAPLFSLFTCFLGELIYITMIFTLMTLRSISLSPYFFYETQICISRFSLEHFLPHEYFFRDLKFNIPPSEAHQFPLQATHLHWFLISDNSFTTYHIVQMRNFSISFRSSYSPLLLSHRALSVLSHLHSCGHCLASGPSVRCPSLGLKIWGKWYKVKGVCGGTWGSSESQGTSGDCHIVWHILLIVDLQHLLVPI